MGGVATLSVLALLVVMGVQFYARNHDSVTKLAFVSTDSLEQTGNDSDASWQQELTLLGLSAGTTPLSTTTTDTVAMIGPLVVAQLAGEYAGLEDTGGLSQENIDAAAQGVAKNVRAVISYKIYTNADIQTDNSTSYERMLVYRNDLRVALEPLLANKDAELNLYAKYIETDDSSYLDVLAAAVKNYRAALEGASKVVVPKDAVNYQKDVLNALSQFTAVVDAMATHPGDALASAALLRTFNDAELAMYTAFDNLSAYYAQKTP